MDFNKRFQTALTNIRDNWFRSLPICNKQEEILWCYTKDLSTKKININPKCIFIRNKETGKIKELSTDKLIEICKKYKNTDEKDLEYDIMTLVFFKNEYKELYEEFYLFAFSETLTDNQKQICKRLLELITILSKDEVLLECYKKLGKEYFEYLQANSN